MVIYTSDRKVKKLDASKPQLWVRKYAFEGEEEAYLIVGTKVVRYSNWDNKWVSSSWVTRSMLEDYGEFISYIE